MQEELRRCNYLGDVESVFKLAKVSISDHETDLTSVSSICRLDSSMNVKPKVCILFFRELGLLTLEGDLIIPTKQGEDIVSGGVGVFARKSAELTMNYLLDNDFVNYDAISFDIENSICMIKKSAFPLSVAVMRNYLIDTGMLKDYSSALYELCDAFETFFEETIKLRKSAFSLEQLKEKQRAQEEQGRKAEEFVVQYEKKRLLGHTDLHKVKQISDFDVSAGFDIVSFDDINSTTIDRFIEVKSYHSTPHFFWSSNEYEQSQIKGDHYYLYLVDMDHCLEEKYAPIIVKNPSKEIMGESDWLVSVASYEITQI